MLSGVYVDPDGDEEDGDEGEVEDGVHEDGEAAGLHGAEAHDPAVRWQLEQQARREQDEQHRRDHHRTPVRHLRSSSILRRARIDRQDSNLGRGATKCGELARKSKVGLGFNRQQAYRGTAAEEALGENKRSAGGVLLTRVIKVRTTRFLGHVSHSQSDTKPPDCWR